MKEAGYPTLTFESLNGLFGPRGTPDQLRVTIAADFIKIAESNPTIAKRLSDIGTIMSILGPVVFTASIDEQRVKLAAIAKTLGIKAAY